MPSDDLAAQHPVEAAFAANLKYARERAGLTQDQLAAKMAELGFAFSQATIWKIEQGRRPVRIAEFQALSDVLDEPAYSLFLSASPATYGQRVQVRAARDRIVQASEAIESATAEYLQARRLLDMVIEASSPHLTDEDRAHPDFTNEWNELQPEVLALAARLLTDFDETERARFENEVSELCEALSERRATRGKH
jgi:transcriptional regulator with XRE-family HTH domain